MQLQRVCHDTLPWLISFSLDLVSTATILFVIAVALVSTFSSTTSPGGEPKCLAIYAPRPEYPSLPNGNNLKVKVCSFATSMLSGRVTFVSIAKITGFAILDKAAIDCFKRWRFKPETCAREVEMPRIYDPWSPSHLTNR